MRRHAKASTAGSTKRQAGGRGRLLWGAVLALLSLLLLATPASAGTATDRPLLFTFDGSDTTIGAFGELRRLGIDQSSGVVYVMDIGHDVIDKFNADGTAANFSATGTSSLSGSGTPEGSFGLNGDGDISVDNSGGATQGRVYVNREIGPVNAFSPAGGYLWQLSGSLFADDCGTAVDAAGHLWVGNFNPAEAMEFDNVGSPPSQIGSVSDTTGNPCRLNLDASGNLFFNQWANKVDKYVGGTFSSTLDPTSTQDIAIDQSSATGNLFTIHGSSFSEFDSTGALIGTFGIDTIAAGKGIAYNKALDRVYVSDAGSNTVEVFGQLTTGTVPDPTIEATTEKGVSKAKFNGKVNPQSAPNSYFFEWKQGEGESWTGAESSTPQVLPEDSSDHAVSFNATGLTGGTTYRVRLVANNTENGLRAVSSPDTFETDTAASAPVVSIAEPSSITTTSAQLSGTVNPKEDAGTSWRIQLSTDVACASEFSDGPNHSLSSEASSPIPVAEELTGLLPGQHYCERISATNSFDTTLSEIKQFETAPIAPTRAATAFAAPRTDTTARLNGYVNPEGAVLTYHFEYSEDGGATWIPLPARENASHARERIVVADELEGLEPDTSYRFRFFAENGAGPASPQGGEETFTTRPSEDAQECPNEDIRAAQHTFYLSDCRGIELVNRPDKGPQHVTVENFNTRDGNPFTPSGNEIIWLTSAGAPGGASGTLNTFLATRGSGGWHSQTPVPPASQQVGGGTLKYILEAASDDFSHFIYVTEESGFAGGLLRGTYVRVNRNREQEVLATFQFNPPWTRNVEVSADAAHVLHVNEDRKPSPPMLEDIGTQGDPDAVSLMSDGSEPLCGVRGDGGFVTGLNGIPHKTPGYHWTSSDGSRVYFQMDTTDGCSSHLSLFVRIREAPAETIKLADHGLFVRATPSGKSGFFTTNEALVGEDQNSDQDVYRWTEGSGLSCITCVVSDADLLVLNLAPKVMISDDFSHVYFESKSQLIPGQGTSGHNNLYVISEGEIRLVADLTDFGLDAAQLSSDGNILTFNTSGSPTADAIAAECLNGESPGQCVELYRYDDREGSIECLSCLRGATTTESVQSANNSSGPAFKASADGSTAVFVTRLPLLPGDINGGFDIYAWRNGTRGLITGGVTEYGGALAAPGIVGVDADGSDVFFRVADPGLTGFEGDSVDNLYDARIGGGFIPPNPRPPCDGDSCQGPLQAAPTPPRSASSTFSGRGNLKTQQARKGSCARKHGKARKRCIRKHKRQAQKARAKAKARSGK